MSRSRSRAERRAERRDEREANAPQLDALELHRLSTSQPSRVIESARKPSASARPTRIAQRETPRARALGILLAERDDVSGSQASSTSPLPVR